MGGGMQKGVLTGLFLLIVTVFLYVGYTGYASRRSGGEAYADGAASGRTRSDVKAEATGTPASGLPATPTTGDAAGTMVAQGGAAASSTGMALPAADSIAPNPPNGMTFGGSGHFQLYRQGDLTWRLNTETGETCVLFATDEEWRKPKVFKAGCRGK